MPTSPTRKALCVGIDDYPKQKSQLEGCVNDARDWKEYLTSIGFQVTVLPDDQATYKGITDGIKSLISDSAPGDHRVFQFSGHGTRVPNKNKGLDPAICPFDYHEGRLIIDNDWQAIASECVEKGALFTAFFDCCRSNKTATMMAKARQATKEYKKGRTVDLSSDELFSHNQFRSLAGKVTNGAFVEFAACGINQFAWEKDGNGDFTAAAMKVVKKFSGTQLTNEEFLFHVNQIMGGNATEGSQSPRLVCGVDQSGLTLRLSNFLA